MRETKFLYHIHIFQELKQPDGGKRLHSCHWLCDFVHNNNNCHRVPDYEGMVSFGWLH